jgi:AAA+ ATPase superfamily predicted ATPase
MNPFSYGTIVRGDSFFDRKEETKLLIDTLSGGNNVVLFAPRRYGKTSLVFRVMEHLEEQGIPCLYIDLMSAFSLERFAELIVEAVRKKQSKLEVFAQELSGWVKKIRPTIEFGLDGSPKFSIDFSEQHISHSTLTQVFDIPQQLVKQYGQVVVVFDEFQEISRFSNDGVEALLRSVIQQQEGVNYLFLGSKTHMMSQMFENKKRPFFNSGIHVQIGALPEDETIEFLQKQFATNNINIGDDEARYLIQCAANIPYYIQLLASFIWQRKVMNGGDISVSDINDSVQDIIALKGDFYHEQFNRYSIGQKQLLRALSRDGSHIFSVDYIRKYKLNTSSTVQKNIKILMEDGIADKTGDTYFISDPFFRRFLQEL